MKKTRKQISDTLDLITVVDDNGEELTFLNGVIQMATGGKFIAARSPIDGQLSLIIEDYVHWVNNQKDIEAWMEQYGSGISQRGMVLHFDRDADRTMFLLRWG
jgi:hypothetical protein